MKHLFICREFPPALYAGGIGTYVFHISRLLAECGETVHIIGQLWHGARKACEEMFDGRLIIHRVPFSEESLLMGWKLNSSIKSSEERGLFVSDFSPQCFSWQAGLLAERLVEQEGIDIIEAPEFEAPLYYFQLRRVLGLGTKRYPPCIIQLHSPLEFIAKHNDWDIYHPYFVTSKRLEDYCIAAADALLCPSKYLARQAESHFGMTKGSIQVIPLPIGNNPVLKRDRDTWEHGTICYVGRLERRKGVLEWIDAAVTVAHEFPSARFEFIGANVLGTKNMSGEMFVSRRIPDTLKSRFVFRGQQNRSSMQQLLMKARIAVVPSRWENFPNTCVEAMSSGLPVIASRNGGMGEMIKDGRSGWIADKDGSFGLIETLRRALTTPFTKIEEMGYSASRDIRLLCDNKMILERHVEFRNQLVLKGAKRSLCLPVNLPWFKRSLSDESARRAARKNSQKGLALVVICQDVGKFFGKCCQSIEQQTQRPVAVVIVNNGTSKVQTGKNLDKVRQMDWMILQKLTANVALAKNNAIEAVLDARLRPIGFVFLNEDDRLKSDFVDVCESVLQRCPDVGLVSCWTQQSKPKNRIRIKPCPSFPYQWVSNEAVSFSAVRTEALLDAGNFSPSMNQGYEDWDLFNAVMASGWVAVTIPKILGIHRERNDEKLYDTSNNAYSYTNRRMHMALLERFPEQVARDAEDIVFLTETYTRQLFYMLKKGTFCDYQNIILKGIKEMIYKILRNIPARMSHLIHRVIK